MATVVPTFSSGAFDSPAVQAHVLDLAETSPAPNGVDDTATIEAACANRKPLRSNATYIYKGAGIDVSRPYLTGSNTTVVNQSTSGYVFDGTRRWLDVMVTGITFTGGQGAIRNRYTGDNVNGPHIVRNCSFTGYTGTAISHNSSDMPYWYIEENLFYAANSTGTMGVALSGLTNISVIRKNRFYRNRVHIKLAQGGNDVKVQANDFLRYDTGTNRVDVWAVTHTTNQNCGMGLEISANKHGNENIDASDYRILCADEDASQTGQLFGDRMPLFAASSGFITGHRVIGNFCYGAGGGWLRSYYVTYTQDTRGCVIGPMQCFGSLPLALFQFAGVVPGNNSNTVVGPVLTDNASYVPLLAVGPTGSASEADGHYIVGSW